MRHTRILSPLGALQGLIEDCEEYGECVLYAQTVADKTIQISTIDPQTIREVRDPSRTS